MSTPTTPTAFIRHAMTGALALALALATTVSVAAAQNDHDTADNPAAKALRICADPSNMPFSNKAKEGFENKIAALLGRKLDVPVDYYWRPEQMGFGRDSLKKWLPNKNRYACDLVISAGSGFDVGRTTLPYYRSSYVMAYLKGHGLDSIKTPQDLLDLPKSERKKLKIGVFVGSPVGDWLVTHGMGPQIVGRRAQSGGFEGDPADMITESLVDGDIDIATIWGPIGGYYAQKQDEDIRLVKFTQKDGPKFNFPVSMAVRYGNEAWLNRVQTLIDNNHDAIIDILKDYGVPLVPLRPEDRVPQEDDDD